MATLQQLETALINADKAGDQDAARKIAAVLQRNRSDPMNQVPGTVVPETAIQQPEPTMGQNIIGAGETALALGTGATAGGLGMIGGTLKGLAEQLLSGQFGTQQAADAVEQAATAGAEALTYAPRTQAGQEQTAAVGEALAPLAALAPFAGEVGAIGRGAKAAVPAASSAAALAPAAVRDAAGAVVAPLKRGAAAITDAIRPPSAEVQAGIAPGPGGAQSAGAAAVEAGTLRQAKANELPVPIKLTEGQKNRSDFGQQRFEGEIAKNAEMGAPIRERHAQQNAQLQQNLDAFIDATGGTAPDLRTVGQSVDKALRSRVAQGKTRIRALYKEAEKSGEMEAPVKLKGIVDHLVENAPEAEVANVLKAARAKAIQLGVAREGESGALIATPVSLKNAELFRRSINSATNAEPTNIRQAAIMKGLIDDETAGAGGQAYKKARAERARFARDYENVGLVKNLIGKKGRSNDRAIALEDVLNRSIVGASASLDDVRQIRKLLQTEGAQGQQAWKDLQGATLQHIKDAATNNVARNQSGDAIVSAAGLDRAVKNLDKGGKLDFVFGKKGAEQIRTINDVAKDVLTTVPGAVNTSNTATVLAAMLDTGLTVSLGGIPAPIASGLRVAISRIQDRKTRARVQKALGITSKEGK